MSEKDNSNKKAETSCDVTDGNIYIPEVTTENKESIKSNGKKSNHESIKMAKVIDSDSYVTKRIDDKIINANQIAYESEQGYREIAKLVVDIVKEYINTQNEKKTPLRKVFTITFSVLLIFQLITIVAFVLFDSFVCIPFEISESLLTTYIISVFVETLGAIAAMIAFAFTSKEESEIVSILTTIIQNFQKYNNSNQGNDKS